MPEPEAPPVSEETAPAALSAEDLAALAERLVRRLRDELRIERERRGPEPGQRAGG